MSLRVYSWLKNGGLRVIGRTKSLGLISRRERWGLTWRGWLLVLVLVVGAVLGTFFSIHPFLAMHRPVETRTLVVEGWIRPFAIKAAAAEFSRGHYDKVYTTGGPVSGLGGYLNDYSTSASIGMGRLKQEGVPADVLEMAPSRVIDRDRTYGAAVALRNHLNERGVKLTSFNIMTEDAHSRRTLLLFRKAFGSDVKIGIISIPPVDYDATHWWRYSEGVREVLSETIAYLYAKVFFTAN